jgi:putative NADPH-quinone reductase
VLRSAQAWHKEPVPLGLKAAQDDIAWAQHVVIFFPLWLGDMPALLKAFLEQVARPGFAVGPEGARPFGHKPLSGRSARVVVTMGMPALAYRWFYRAHSVKSLERNILGFVGFAPVNETLIGLVDQLGETGVAKWQARLRKLGREAA